MPDHRSRDFRPADDGRAFSRGLKLGFPIFLGYVPAGMAFGILARTIGFSALEAAVCSATALAGAGQFIALDVMRAGGGVAAVLVATSVVNLRYVLFAGTMSPYLRREPPGVRTILAFFLTDETFAVNITDLRAGHASWLSMAGVGTIAWAGWVLGTAMGAVGAGAIGDPDRWGVQFAMPAMFTALFVALAEDRRQVIIGLAAAAIVVALPILSSLGIGIPEGWFVVIAAMIAATLGTVVFR